MKKLSVSRKKIKPKRMSQITKDFIELIKKRSDENEKSMNALFEQRLIGNCISILRQELDTFIRIIYLGLEPNLAERERLMKSTLNGTAVSMNCQSITLTKCCNAWKTSSPNLAMSKCRSVIGEAVWGNSWNP